jgi:CHAT domain
MRLRLRLTDAPELAELPWEFLYDPRHNKFLAQSRHTPLVRYLDLPNPPSRLGVQGPLRLLVMISNPSDYPALDVEREWNDLTGALAQQQAEGQVVVERLAANMGTLRARLRREEFHIFHFVGHGFYRSDWGDGVLVMEDRNGRPHEVTGEELGGLLNEYDQIRLAVLNACEGARSGISNPFAGTAQSLIQQGLPAVVAMQFEITDAAAIVFSRELYAAIADGYPLEAALAEARGTIRDEGNLTEWGTPVLYSRSSGGCLFDLTKHVQISQADRKAREEADRKAREEADRKAREEADRKAKIQPLTLINPTLQSLAPLVRSSTFGPYRIFVDALLWELDAELGRYEELVKLSAIQDVYKISTPLFASKDDTPQALPNMRLRSTFGPAARWERLGLLGATRRRLILVYRETDVTPEPGDSDFFRSVTKLTVSFREIEHVQTTDNPEKSTRIEPWIILMLKPRLLGGRSFSIISFSFHSIITDERRHDILAYIRKRI